MEAGTEESLIATLRGVETIFNPNKHAIALRETAAPQAGEVWVDEPNAPGALGGARGAGGVRVGGRLLGGVSKLERFVAWHLWAADGAPAGAETVARAAQMLLCNDAFQEAIIG